MTDREVHVRFVIGQISKTRANLTSINRLAQIGESAAATREIEAAVGHLLNIQFTLGVLAHISDEERAEE